MSTELQIHAHHTGGRPATSELRLTFDARQKSRFRATLSDGRGVGVMLPRGQGLRDGDLLEANEGSVIVVRAVPEAVSQVRSSDVLLLSRAAYHLGNRHMPVQILTGELRYHHDHVLDDMLRQLGLTPVFAQLPFEPESGAYGTGHAFASHPHYHGHSHDDHHSHEHAAGHDHEHAHPHAEHAPGHVMLGRKSPHRAGVIHVNWDEIGPTESDQ